MIDEHTQDLKAVQDERDEVFEENEKLRDDFRDQSNLITELSVDLQISRNERDRAQMSTGSDQLEIMHSKVE
eukprot:TRINITY_DN9738_c0_g1_i1.p2 TRINITY_DN9738_c0_g1~~TRINITY_DN9738_c0_g1_i1.p2  ORF type:complete len:72 (+),score=10.31 TRINITY_DN9738_c0_g1_i1:55-270(+)